jgi:hypothetical protein
MASFLLFSIFWRSNNNWRGRITTGRKGPRGNNWWLFLKITHGYFLLVEITTSY